MSDVSEIKKLGVGATIGEGFNIGFKNFGPIVINTLLYVLTCWIPYINIGTTIGFSVGIIAKASRGEAISFTEIFDPKYRKPMGDFFLTCGLMSLGIGAGMALFIIPGCVLGLAWFLAVLLVVDKEKKPVESLSLSSSITYGNKGRIFWILFIVCVVVSVLASIFTVILGDFIGGFLVTILTFISIIVIIGIEASIYKQLASNV